MANQARKTPPSSDILPIDIPAGTPGLNEGDIITLGSEGNPARDWRTGIPIPHTQKFKVVIKEPS
jgi:hypothetical protein